jgi:hypothetical protein
VSATTQVKTNDVTDFFKDMIGSTMAFEVDDEGYVIKKASGDRVTISEGGQNYPLLVYQETIKDQNAQIINPLAEGLGSTPSSLWFFNVQRTALLGRICTLILSILKTALDEKKAKKDVDKETHIPMEILSIAAKIIDDVDDRMVEEFNLLMSDKDDIGEFFTIWYQKKHLKSILRCALFDPEGDPNLPTWRSKFPTSKVRKKTWPVLETVVLAVLGISDKDDIRKFAKKAEELSCARLSSFLLVIMAVYQEINPLLDAINPDLSLDMSKFAFHLNRLSAYADIAKFMVQPTRTATAVPTPVAIPGAPAVPGFTQPTFPGHQPMGQPMVPGATMLPGPIYTDGRPSAPVMVAPAQPPQQQGYVSPSFPPPPMQQGFMPAGPQGGYYGYNQPMPQQQPYYQSPQFMGGNDIPFAGPYVGQQPGMGGGPAIQLILPGAPGPIPRYG